MATVARSLVDVMMLELVFANLANLAADSATTANTGNRDDIQEMAFFRLQKIGHTIGEQLIASLLATSPPTTAPQDTLQVMKYICCDFWSFTFGKQVDTLKTNHRGVFVLVDNDCGWLGPFVAAGVEHVDVPALTRLYLGVACGVLAGALSGGFRLKANVSAQLTDYPICSFDVQII